MSAFRWMGMPAREAASVRPMPYCQVYSAINNVIDGVTLCDLIPEGENMPTAHGNLHVIKQNRENFVTRDNAATTR
ncbi:MAG: hypothetical protein ACLRUN_14090 [Christensenellales bacterium]